MAPLWVPTIPEKRRRNSKKRSRGEMASADDTLGAQDTVSTDGVRVLRELWDIPRRAPREPAPEKVDTDIYNVPVTNGHIPHRRKN
jgi:hypothetical protein